MNKIFSPKRSKTLEFLSWWMFNFFGEDEKEEEGFYDELLSGQYVGRKFLLSKSFPHSSKATRFHRLAQ